jgi:uncharacterized protein
VPEPSGPGAVDGSEPGSFSEAADPDLPAGPSIWVDADACPVVLRDVLFRAAERTGTRLTMVANKSLRTPPSQYIRSVRVARGFDVADDRIVAALASGDLVVTGDVPLAAAAIKRGARVLDMRGNWVDDNSIGDRLSMRDLPWPGQRRACAPLAGGTTGLCQSARSVSDGVAALRAGPCTA